MGSWPPPQPRTIVSHPTATQHCPYPRNMASSRRLRHQARALCTGNCAPSCAAAATEAPEELSPRQKFLLDMRGFLVLPGVLSVGEVAGLNAAADASWDSEYTDWLGDTHACRRAAHQSNSFHELVGMLEWSKPHCAPFRNLLAHPGIVPAMNTCHGPGWRMDHSPFMIAGDGTNAAVRGSRHPDSEGNRRAMSQLDKAEAAVTGGGAGELSEPERQRLANGNIGGYTHGHIWDPEYRYRFANGRMRSGHMIMAFQLRDIQPGWGGFGIIPASHKSSFPLPPSLVA